MDNSVRIDYFAVTVKDVPPEEVLEEILLIPQVKFALNVWGININATMPVQTSKFTLTKP